MAHLTIFVWVLLLEQCSLVIKFSKELVHLENHADRLVQERCNSIADALELRLSCSNPLIWDYIGIFQGIQPQQQG